MLRSIKKLLDKTLEFVVMVCVGLLVLDVLWQVFTRRVLNNPSKWTEELAVILLVWVALLGAAVALGRGAHLGIDYFASKLSYKKRVFTEIISFVLIALFAIYVMVYGGFDLVRSTLELGQITPALGLKMGYVYLAVPVSGLFMLLYSIIGQVERVKAISNPSKEAK